MWGSIVLNERQYSFSFATLYSCQSWSVKYDESNSRPLRLHVITTRRVKPVSFSRQGNEQPSVEEVRVPEGADNHICINDHNPPLWGIVSSIALSTVKYVNL